MATTGVTSASDRQAISRLKVTELRQLCRDIGIKCSGKKKSDFIEAVVEARRQNSENTAPDPDPTVQQQRVDFEVAGYRTDPVVDIVPPVKFLHVYDWIVEKSGRNNKCLDRGVKHFDDGDIQDLACKEISDTIILFLTKCVASQKRTKYVAFASLNKVSGECIDGKCDCPQGISGNCSHVCGLLLSLEFIHRTKEQNPGDVSCTSRLCQWRRPRTLKVTPKPLSDINIYKPAYGRAAKRSKTSDFDPRRREARSGDPAHVHLFLKDLMAISPNTGMQQLWNLPVETPDVGREVEIEECPLDAMVESLLICPKEYGTPAELSDEQILQHVDEQVISQELSDHVESITRMQALCPLWKRLHTGRLTSSMFGEIYRSTKSGESRSLVKRIMGSSSIDRLPWTVRWGKDNEARAIKCYKDSMEKKGAPVTVTATGITLSTKQAFLGASSDGRVTDTSQPEGMKDGALEVKCPCSVRGDDIRHLSFHDICTKYPSFHLKQTGDNRTLKRTSNFYAQVQGEIAILGVPWVDFVCWNLVDLHVERIFFDIDFWENDLFPKLCEFYTSKIVPQILEH